MPTPTLSGYGAEVSAGVPRQNQPRNSQQLLARTAFAANRQAHIFPITGRKDEKHHGPNESFGFIL